MKSGALMASVCSGNRAEDVLGTMAFEMIGAPPI